MLYKIILIISFCLIWAPFVQTLGHVWLYTSIIVVSIIGLKMLLPHLIVFVLVIFAWWRLSSVPMISATLNDVIDILTILFGRNAT